MSADDLPEPRFAGRRRLPVAELAAVLERPAGCGHVCADCRLEAALEAMRPPAPVDDGPLAVTVEQVAEALSLSTDTVYELTRAGTLPSIRVGRAVRVPRAALLEFLNTGGST